MSIKTFSSGETEVKRSVEEFYTFISDFNNFRLLLPPNVSNWSSTTDTCSFMLEGMPQLNLKITEKIPDKLVVITPDASSPISFELRCNMRALNATNCIVDIQVNAELNPFIAMMVSRPLENFVKMLGEKLKSF
jgi:hypothetical protein